jgi:ribonuclease HI
MNLIINTDGASRGNPGPASYGYIIKVRDGAIVHQEGKTIGITTNNVAEYTGVLEAFKYILEYLKHKAPHEIEVITDSQLVAMQLSMQLSGKYKIKSEHLRLLIQEIWAMEPNLGKVTYRNVPRAQNFIADKLANQALDREI